MSGRSFIVILSLPAERADFLADGGGATEVPSEMQGLLGL